MDSHDQAFFDRLMELTEENNKLLHGLRRAARWGRALRVFYWVVIIGISIGALYFIQPYVDQLMDVYGGLQEQINSVKNITGSFGSQ